MGGHARTGTAIALCVALILTLGLGVGQSAVADDSMHTAVVYAIDQVKLFSYSDDTSVQIYDSSNQLVWNDGLADGSHASIPVSRGVYRIEASKRLAVLTGDPESSVVGYYAADAMGRGASHRLMTYVPPSEFSEERVIVFAYQEGTTVRVTDLDTGTDIWTGELGRGGHQELFGLSNRHIEVTGTRPVSVLTYFDQGYAVPAEDGRWSGTSFFTYASNLGGWTNDVNIASFQDATTVTVTDSSTQQIVWSGTIDAGGAKSLPIDSATYLRITSNKPVTVNVAPFESWLYADYHHGRYVADAAGSRVGQDFVVTKADGGEFYLLGHQNGAEVTVSDSSGQEVETYTLHRGQAQAVSTAPGAWRVTSDKAISIWSGWGSWSAEFAPVFGASRLVGTVNVAVAFVETADVDHDPAHDADYYNEIYDELVNYYDENGFGTVDINIVNRPDTVEWQRLPKNQKDYATPDPPDYSGWFDLVNDAHDVTGIEAGRDGIDVVVYVHSGKAAQEVTDSRERITTAAAGPYIVIAEGLRVGTWAHEIGHSLGAIDTYLLGNAGQWDLMGSGNWNGPFWSRGSEPPHMSSFIKEQIYWLSYESRPKSSYGEHWIEALPRLTADDTIFKYDVAENEYYILETRNTDDSFSTWDNSVPKTALVLWYVHSRSGLRSLNVNEVLQPPNWLGMKKTYKDPVNDVQFTVTDSDDSAGTYKLKVDVQPLDSRSFLEKMVGVTLDTSASIWQGTAGLLDGFFIPPLEGAPLPDLDLHAFTEDGRHVGRNYITGEYEIEIEGAIASGDRTNDHEWILVPEGTEARFVLSAKPNESFFDVFPDVTDMSDTTEDYTLTGLYISPEEGIFRSQELTASVDAGIEFMHPVDVSPGQTGHVVEVGTGEPWEQARSVVRIAGDDRYKTAVAASQRAFANGAETVVLATGQNWPDALGGSALAGAIDGPLLLTRSTTLPEDVRAEILRLGAGRAYVLGGEAAVSDAVMSELETLLGPLNVVRLGGSTRYETARLVADESIKVLGNRYDGSALVTTGRNFPDALAASPLAAHKGWPILLVPGSGDLYVPDDTASATIVGGTLAVPSSVEASLRSRLGADSVSRESGTNRYETAAAVAEFGVSADMTWNRVGVATGQAFPDALTGGRMLGKLGAVLLLAQRDAVPHAGEEQITGNREDISIVNIIGGANAVSTGVEVQLTSLLQ